MAAAVGSHLAKTDPDNPSAWINLAYSVRRAENIERAEAILLKARDLHPKSALMLSTSRATPVSRMEEAKVRLRHAIDLDKDIRRLALDDEDLRPRWDWIGGVTSDQC